MLDCWPKFPPFLFRLALLRRVPLSLYTIIARNGASDFSFSRASWGPNSPGGGGFMLFLLFLLVQPCQAVSATSKPRVVEASTTLTGTAQIVSPFVAAVAKPCGTHGLPNGAQKRAFRRARNRVAQAGPDGHTWYRGRRCSAADLGLKRSISSFTAPLHSARARNTARRVSLPCLRLPKWPAEEGASSSFAASRQCGFRSLLSLNLGGRGCTRPRLGIK